MKSLDLTLDTHAANVALDEALLLAAETSTGEQEILRLWESPHPLVVVGRSSRLADEVTESACQQAGVPIVRRASGGAAIVAGPGCLMYAVVLNRALRPELGDLDATHRLVLDTLVRGLTPLASGVERQGTSDLAVAGRKFSGNSLRVRRTHVLYHGTLLYDFELPLVGRLLKMPPRQPDYRHGRSHGEFIANLPVTRANLVEAIRSAWPLNGSLAQVPLELTARLVADKYAQPAWNASL